VATHEHRPLRRRIQASVMRVINVPMRFVLGLPFATPLSGRLMLVFLTGRQVEAQPPGRPTRTRPTARTRCPRAAGARGRRRRGRSPPRPHDGGESARAFLRRHPHRVRRAAGPRRPRDRARVRLPHRSLAPGRRGSPRAKERRANDAVVMRTPIRGDAPDGLRGTPSPATRTCVCRSGGPGWPLPWQLAGRVAKASCLQRSTSAAITQVAFGCSGRKRVADLAFVQC
jgi:hypothetical protein